MGLPAGLGLNRPAGDPLWASVVLLTDMRSPNGTTFTDAKGHALTAAGAVAISGGEAVFPGSTADMLTTPDSNDWNFGNEFCIELFGVRIPSLPGATAALLSHWNAFTPFANNRSWALWLDADGQLRFALSTNGQSGGIGVWTSGSTITAGTYDLRFERWNDAGTLRGNFYVNGSRLGSQQVMAGTVFNATGSLAIGTDNPNATTASNRNPFTGGMKVVRLTNAARNPGAASYQVPTLPLPTSA